MTAKVRLRHLHDPEKEGFWKMGQNKVKNLDFRFFLTLVVAEVINSPCFPQVIAVSLSTYQHDELGSLQCLCLYTDQSVMNYIRIKSP